MTTPSWSKRMKNYLQGLNNLQPDTHNGQVDINHADIRNLDK